MDELFEVPGNIQPVQQPVMFSRVHISFETWFVGLFRKNLLPTGRFSIEEMRSEYMTLCWMDEYLWKEWCKDGEG